MTLFRERIGKEGCEFMLGLTVVAGINTRTVSKASVAIVNVDTRSRTRRLPSRPMPGCITRPEVRWYSWRNRGELTCVKATSGIERALMMNGRYAHADTRSRPHCSRLRN